MNPADIASPAALVLPSGSSPTRRSGLHLLLRVVSLACCSTGLLLRQVFMKASRSAPFFPIASALHSFIFSCWAVSPKACGTGARRAAPSSDSHQIPRSRGHASLLRAPTLPGPCGSLSGARVGRSRRVLSARGGRRRSAISASSPSCSTPFEAIMPGPQRRRLIEDERLAVESGDASARLLDQERARRRCPTRSWA